MYIAHKSKEGTVQTLKMHLQGVSDLAAAFAAPFGAGEHAAFAGILHDAGKYSPAGQKRMQDPEHTAKVDHATAGAKIALNRKDPFAASAIVGHHGGMPDLGGKGSVEGDCTLQGRCKKELTGELDYSAYWQENSIDEKSPIPEWLIKDQKAFARQFYTRMLFSCLVDADFLDTESFMNPTSLRKHSTVSMNEMLDRLQRYISPWLQRAGSLLNEKRNEILKECLEKGTGRPGLYTLTVPTGGGKTVSSLAFALTHAVAHGMSRIIYVVPYISIIEQNAAIFADILGEDNVLEHHSGVETDATNDQEEEQVQRRMLATENWDSPIIVTTAVQFFESLFSNKPSKCRKLHNIANSVIIFDEAQMMPLDYLRPCVQAICELTRKYHVTAVLCTATQPSLQPFIQEYLPGETTQEICQNPDELKAFFRRVRFRDGGSLHLNQVAESLMMKDQVLCIVNTRKKAQELFHMLPDEGSYHLSTWMTPEHRSAKLKEIRERLTGGEKCRVISTSLLEAGVDIDFPQVWREKAGLDSILQSAGRCNREGKKKAEESEVVLFSFPDGPPKGILPNKTAADIAMESATYPDEAAAIQTYFEQLYRMKGTNALDSHDILTKCRYAEFKTIADNFHLIENDTRTVYIPNGKNTDDLQELRNGRINRALIRRLGRSSVNIYPWDWEMLRKSGAVFLIDDYSGILENTDYYDDACGLNPWTEGSEAYFL